MPKTIDEGNAEKNGHHKIPEGPQVYYHPYYVTNAAFAGEGACFISQSNVMGSLLHSLLRLSEVK